MSPGVAASMSSRPCLLLTEGACVVAPDWMPLSPMYRFCCHIIAACCSPEAFPCPQSCCCCCCCPSVQRTQLCCSALFFSGGVYYSKKASYSVLLRLLYTAQAWRKQFNSGPAKAEDFGRGAEAPSRGWFTGGGVAPGSSENFRHNEEENKARSLKEEV